MSPIFSLVAAEALSIRNRWNRAEAPARRFRSAMIILAGIIMLLIFAASYRAFQHLLHGLTLTPELGPPIVLRLIEMAHLLFFMMLIISSLSVALSVFYLDPEIHFLRTTPLGHGPLVAFKLLTTILRSSWFVLFAAAPLLLGYAAASSPAQPLPPRAPSLFLENLVASLPRFFPMLAILALYVSIPSLLGAAGSMLIARFVPARRAKTVLAVLAGIGLVLVILGLRWMTPERFLRPHIDPDIGVTLSAIAEPASPLLPSAWAADAIVSGQRSALAKILGAAAAASAAAFFTARLLHFDGLQRIVTDRDATVRRGRFDAPELLLRPFPPAVRLVARKDLLLFWRDPSQWSQLIILLALVVLYVFNFRQFRGEIQFRLLRDVIAFVNLGMAGFVLTAIANRFVFSALSLEGRSIWLVRSSPFPLGNLLLAKAVMPFFPLLLLSETITLLSNHAIEVSSGFAVSAALTVFLMTAALVSLGVGLGALSPRFDMRDPAQIGMTPAGILFMGIGLIYVGAAVLLTASQALLGWMQRYLGTAPGGEWLWILGIVAVALHAGAVILPLRLGLARIRVLELRS